MKQQGGAARNHTFNIIFALTLSYFASVAPETQTQFDTFYAALHILYIYFNRKSLERRRKKEVLVGHGDLLTAAIRGIAHNRNLKTPSTTKLSTFKHSCLFRMVHEAFQYLTLQKHTPKNVSNVLENKKY